MDNKKKVFQYVLMAVFGLGAIAAVLVFSGKIPLGGSADQEVSGDLVIWGTLPERGLNATLDTLNKTHKNLSAEYEEKDPRTYKTELLEAIASGAGPDLFIIPSDQLWENQPRLFNIPFASYPKSTYQGTFIDQGEMSTDDKGIYAFPLVGDPLVMYYNRSILSGSFLSAPPKNWDELMAMVPTLTQKNDSGFINQSALALGSYNNITHAKDIISLLMFQAGTPITKRGVGGSVISVINAKQSGEREGAAERALAFYTRFSKQGESVYTWNPGLPNDKQQFLSGKLAFYLGYASEMDEIRQKNPNLHFDVTLVPQRATANTVVTFGNIYSIGISRLSQNRSAAATFLGWITAAEQSQKIAADLKLVPVRKDLLANKPKDNAQTTLFYNTMIASRNWIDPSAEQTNVLYSEAIRNLTSGAFASPAQAVQILHAGISGILD